jgi:hypothetical protein
LPAGHPLDSLERTQGEVTEFRIEGTDLLPGGFALHQVEIRRRYTVAERWAWEESSPEVFDVAATGFVPAAARRQTCP